MRKLVLFLISTLVLLFPNNVLAHSETKIIEMTSDGFVPQELSVDTSSTVIFINHDTFSHWPASNTHPTHELYPAFDPKRPIELGQSWSFKPKKVGAWKYHDHLFPHIRGAIIVTSEKDQKEIKESDLETKVTPKEKNILIENAKNLTDKIISSFENLFKKGDINPKTNQSFDFAEFKKADYQKQSKIAEESAKSIGAEKTWQNIKTAFKNESGSSGNIHDLAHLAGNFLYQEKGLSGLKSCSSDFAFGCYHGLLDKAFAKSLNDLNKAEDACLKLGRKNSGPVASCIHGIGHGIASYFLTSDIKKSLSACRKLSSGEEYCFDGVFMEFVRSAPESFFRINDPLYPCNSLENSFGYIYSFSCGRNQPPLLMGRFKMPFEDVARICVASASKPFREGCVEALGFSLAATLEPEKIIEGCSVLGIEFSKTCIQKAAGELVFQDVPGWWEKSQSLCKGVTEGTDVCLAYVNNIASQYGRKRK